MSYTITANNDIRTKNELSASVALYLGAALIVTTCLATFYLPHAGILPTLFLIGFYQMFCLVMPDKLATFRGRRALVIAGSLASITCHLMIMWLFHTN